jgi:hypothetical protein
MFLPIKLLTLMPNCLLDIPTCVPNRHLKPRVFPTKVMVFGTISLGLLQSCSSQSSLPSKCQHLFTGLSPKSHNHPFDHFLLTCSSPNHHHLSLGLLGDSNLYPCSSPCPPLITNSNPGNSFQTKVRPWHVSVGISQWFSIFFRLKAQVDDLGALYQCSTLICMGSTC